MKAIIQTKFHRVIVEPLYNQHEETLKKKAEQIARKRNIISTVEIIKSK